MGEDESGARLESRDGLPRQGRTADLSRCAGLQSRRIRLHDLHRQQRAAARTRSRTRSTSASSSSAACSPVIAISKGAFSRMCARIISPRRRSSSPMRSSDRSTVDLTTEPSGQGKDGRPVYLKDIWPTQQEIQTTMLAAVSADMFRAQYAHVFDGDALWQNLPVPTGDRFTWEADSTYIRKPPFLEHLSREPAPAATRFTTRACSRFSATASRPITSRRPDRSRPTAPRASTCRTQGVQVRDFNSYGARRGNHEVMVRGTFANVRLRNQLAPGTEGGWTTYLPGSEVMSIYDASMKYQTAGVPLVIYRGQGIRVRFVARLGRQRHPAPRRPRRHRRELRAHSPQQSRQHGRAAAGVQGGRVGRVDWIDRPRGDRHRRVRRRADVREASVAVHAKGSRWRR